MKALLRRRRRQLLFLCVGATCFLTQYAALTAMVALGAYRPLANAIGFVLSAQLNFTLSARLTWRDRSSAAIGRGFWARWVSYNGTALISLAVNTAVFTVAYHRLGNLAGAALGVLSGMCVTYLVCDLLIFRDRPKFADRWKPWTRMSHRRLSRAVPAEHPLTAAEFSLAPTGHSLAAAAPDHRPAATSWDRQPAAASRNQP